MIAVQSTWRTAKLADVTLPVKKADPAIVGPPSFRYVDIGVVDGTSHRIEAPVVVEASAAPGRARQHIKAGDTVFSTVRPYLEKIAYISEALNGQVASTGFCVLRPGPEVEPRFLFHFMTSDVLLKQVLPLQRGVSYPAVRDKDVKNSVVPIPPLSEQRRIVEILEDHLSRLDAAANYLSDARRRSDTFGTHYVDSQLRQVKSQRRAVGDLLSEPMRNGHSARAVADGKPGIRTLTLTAVTKGEFSTENTKITSADPARVASLWLQPDDVLVERSNTPELVGTTRLYDGPPNWAIYPDLVIRLRAGGDVLPDYLAIALNSSVVQRSLRSRAKGLAGSMPKIDQGTIADQLIPLPDLPIQREIADRIATMSSNLVRTVQMLERQTARSVQLRRSVLAAAFSGKLTGRRTDDEVVEELAEAMN
ncbi:restriction endonuclease subunit S [Branchiibius cervicis]|uniref:Restriction endonuclease subunit S n=1 Tax=Branchiibius cervicis TaxID=908252 RepID=A0ABW2AX74_9MICO